MEKQLITWNQKYGPRYSEYRKEWYKRNRERISMERRIKYAEKVGKRLDEDRRKIDDTGAPKICQDNLKKLELIRMAVNFVDKVESRKGMVSFEELFGEMLNINYFLPASEYDDDSIKDQLQDIWINVRHFAKSFKKEIDGVDYTEHFKKLKEENLCKYCEESEIQNSSNACHKCRRINIYISKLD